MERNVNGKLTIPSDLLANNNNNNQRSIVLGFDGLNFDIVQDLVKEGKLNNFSRLIEQGSFGIVDCPPPTNSIAGWTSFRTGTNTGKHGVYNYETFVEKDYRFVATDNKMCGAKSIWDILSRNDKRSIVLNIIGTYPPTSIKGAQICGRPIREDGGSYTHPPELAKELERINYRAPFPRKYKNEDEYYEGIDCVCEIADHFLQESTSWDFLALVLIEPDAFQHVFADDCEKIKNLYLKLDSVIGKFLKHCDSRTTLIVCSDHGIAKVDNAFYIERWLCKNGYLKLLPYKEQRKEIKWEKWNDKNKNGLLKFILFKLFKDYIHTVYYCGVGALAPKKIKDWVKGKERELGLDPVDWRKSIIFRSKRDGSTSNNTGFRINKNCVNIRHTKAEYERIINQINEKLIEFREEYTNKKIVKNVLKDSDIYHGNMINRLPDVIVQVDDNYYCAPYSSNNEDLKYGPVTEKFAEVKRFHTREGSFFALGPCIKKGQKVNCNIVDIAPTVLYILGVQIPSYIDGKVIDQAIESQYLNQNPVEVETTHDDGVLLDEDDCNFKDAKQLDQSIRDELIRLGYE